MRTKYALTTMFLVALVSAFVPAGAATRYVRPVNPGAAAPYTNWASASTNIQLAIDEAANGDVVLLTNGTYAVWAEIGISKTVTVTSVNGSDATIVDGGFPSRTNRCFSLNNAGARLDGLTIRRGGTTEQGGGVACDPGTVQNCTITENSAENNGGGIMCWRSESLVLNCLIAFNTATNGTNNRAGGGVALSEGAIARGCLIVSNTARFAGGLFLLMNSGSLADNCTISGNDASDNGGGVFMDASGVLRNTVVYFNTGPNPENDISDMGGGTYLNSCAPTLTGDGNITNDPLFTATFQLAAGSLCIDRGTNQSWMAGAFDLAGHPRIINANVDMGAYEYNTAVPTKIIGLSGNLAFGDVTTGTTAMATLTITNSGDTALTVSSISYPGGFSGAWSGTIAVGNATNVTVTFAPVALTLYSGTVTVSSDATSGGNTISASGMGTAVSTNEKAITGFTITTSHSGTLVNGPAWTSGKYGNGLSLSAGKYVTVPAPTPDIYNITGALTIAMWVKPNSVTCSGADPAYALISKRSDNYATPYEFWIGNGGSLVLQYWGTDIKWPTFLSTGTITTGAWQHVAVTRSFSGTSATVTFYINGVEAGTSTSATGPAKPSSDPVWISRDGYHTGCTDQGSYSGLIDEVQMYNRGLSALEISRICANNSSAITNRVGNWRLDEDSGATASDTLADGAVNEAAKTVAVKVPVGTDVTALVPRITVSPLATVAPLSGVAQNFISPVTYTVTAENLTTQDYTVTVSVIDRHTLTVASAHGGADPGTITADYNTDLSQFITNSPVAEGSLTQERCVGGMVVGNDYTQVSPTNITLTLTNDATLTWTWQTNYWLEVDLDNSGALGPASGWYPAGSTQIVSYVLTGPGVIAVNTAASFGSLAPDVLCVGVVSNTVHLSIQLETSPDLVPTAWTNAGPPVDWFMPVLTNKAFYRVGIKE